MYYFLKCGPDRETDDENLGYSGFTNQMRPDPVNSEDMKGPGDKNLPQVKDVRVYLKPIQFSPITFFICFLTEKKFIIEYCKKAEYICS